MLQAGKLKWRVSIQERVPGQDDSGQPLDTWQEVLRVYAQVEGSTTRTQQRFTAAGYTAMVTYVVTIRWPRNVTIRSGMRLVLNDLVYEIQYLEDPDAGRVQLDLYCVQRDEGIPAESDGGAP